MQLLIAFCQKDYSYIFGEIILVFEFIDVNLLVIFLLLMLTDKILNK